MQKVILLSITLAFLIFVFWYRGPGYLRSAAQFKTFVAAKQPVFDEIAQWAANAKVVDNGFFVSIPKNEWPAPLKTMAYGNYKNPAYVSIRERPRAVWIEYGGGLGHWGMIMDLAKSGQLEEFKKDYLLRVNDRDIVWWELQP